MAYRNPILREAAQREANAATNEMEESDARLLRALRAVHSPFGPQNGSTDTPTAEAKSSNSSDVVGGNRISQAVSKDTEITSDDTPKLESKGSSFEHKAGAESNLATNPGTELEAKPIKSNDDPEPEPEPEAEPEPRAKV